MSITFSYLYINVSKDNRIKQDKINNQASELTNLDESNRNLSTQLSIAQGELTTVQKDIDNLTQSKVFYVGKYKITYYCACEQCCGKTNGITASGVKAKEGVTVAADTSKLPFGTRIYIKGIGWRTVQDRGGAIKGNRLDIYISSHNNPMPYNVQNLDVWMVLE